MSEFYIKNGVSFDGIGFQVILVILVVYLIYVVYNWVCIIIFGIDGKYSNCLLYYFGWVVDFCMCNLIDSEKD